MNISDGVKPQQEGLLTIILIHLEKNNFLYKLREIMFQMFQTFRKRLEKVFNYQ